MPSATAVPSIDLNAMPRVARASASVLSGLKPMPFNVFEEVRP
jgi:hypothetical protein